MDATIDLDAAAHILEGRRAAWLARGLDVGPITWAEGQTTVFPVVTDRASVSVPWSMGVAVRAGEQEGQLILYASASADFDYWAGGADDEPVYRVPGYRDEPLDLGRWGALVDEFGAIFRVPAAQSTGASTSQPTADRTRYIQRRNTGARLRPERWSRRYDIWDSDGLALSVTLAGLDTLLDARRYPADFWACVGEADKAFSAGDSDCVVEWPTGRRLPQPPSGDSGRS